MAERAESDVQSDQDSRTSQQIYKHWAAQLELAAKDHKPFVDAGRKVVTRFKSCKDKPINRGGKRLNILYSNTEHLRAALYGKSAVPDVRRRFAQEDKVGTLAAEIIEKALVYCQETYDSDRPIELAILDYLLPGRGVVRIEYEPVFGQRPDVAGGGVGEDYISEQHLRECYVFWEDFLVSPARVWADVLKDGWVSFKHTMSRADLRENFPDVAADVPLNWLPEMADKREIMDSMKKAEVFEIWNAADRKRYWIVKGFDRPLRIDEDPLGLEQFFPLPEPPAYYSTTDTIVPEPEFHVYQDQADDLDEIVARISKLTRALKRRGVYDQSVEGLSKLANAADNQFIPVQNYQALATKGGLAAAFQTEDISVIAAVLLQLYQQRDMLVAQIWEIVGIGDIQRGASDPNETLGAQQLKAQFGGQRMMRRQRSIQRWVRDILKLKAEILAEHFEPQILMQMTGVQPDPENPQILEQAFQLLRSDKMRGYRIDVETDSTVFEDAGAEKKSVSEALQAISAFMQVWAPLVQAQPSLGPVAFELLKFGLTGFKATRAIEDAIEDVAAQFEQMAQQPPPPSPEEQKLQAEQAKNQGEMQLKQAEAQIKAQSEQQRLVFEQQKHEQEMQFKREEHEMTMGLERERMAMDQASRAQEFEFKQAESVQNREMKSQEMAQTREMHEQTLSHNADERETKDALERDKAGLPANPTRKIDDKMSQMLEALAQVGQAIAVSSQQQAEAAQAQQQTNQAFTEAMAGIAKQLSAPRRRTITRDPMSGRALHADDVMVQ